MVTQGVRYSIEELAERVGLNRRTVRYYIQLGLVDRPVGETRAAYYTSKHLEQLMRVTSLSAEGLSLEAIGRLVKSQANASGQAAPTVIGSVEVRSHLTVAPGLELVVESGRAGLSPEQLKQLFRDVLAAYTRIKEQEQGEQG